MAEEFLQINVDLARHFKGIEFYDKWNRFSYSLYPLEDLNNNTEKLHYHSVHPKILNAFNKLCNFDLLQKLENSHKINWLSDKCRRLYIVKLARGQSLFDAVSTAMYGFDDNVFNMSLTNLCEQTLLKSKKTFGIIERLFYELFKYSIFTNEDECLMYSELFHDKELDRKKIPKDVFNKWKVYCICNTIRRPIVVFTEPGQGGNNLAFKIEGVYLPLETEDADYTFRFPIVLAYHEGRFEPLVQMKSDYDPTSSSLPLVDAQCNLLNVHFGVLWNNYPKNLKIRRRRGKFKYLDLPERLSLADEFNLMIKYLFVTIVEKPSNLNSEKTYKFPCARLSTNLPRHYEDGEKSFIDRLTEEINNAYN